MSETDFSIAADRVKRQTVKSPSATSKGTLMGQVGCIAASLCLLICGCTVGPDFHKPAAPDVSTYTPQPLQKTVAGGKVVGGEVQRFVNGADVAGDWWTLFRSRQLNVLIEQSLEKNPDLKSAQAALTVAHENMLAQRGGFFPSVTAGFSASRQKDPSGALAAVPSNNAFLYNLLTPQVSVAYVPDVFGLNRRTTESLQAQEQQVRFQMVATYNTLTANVVVAAIQLASLEAQIETTRELVESNAKMVEILKYQFSKGTVSGIEVAAQDSQLAQFRTGLPPLLKQRDQQRHALAVLTGRFPSQASDDPFVLSSLHLPQDLPLSLPSALVAQRPDVLQAEASLHAASAQIGVAVANRLPNIQLSANVGSTALAIGDVLKAGSGFWSLGANLTAPIFQGGTLMHQQRAAEAAYLQAAEQYRSTVLTAFANVADTLAALEQDAEGLKAAVAAADAAKITFDLSQFQLHDGSINYLALLSAEQAYQQARIGLVQAQAARFADTAALYQALGGGWWHRAQLTQNEASAGAADADASRGPVATDQAVGNSPKADPVKNKNEE